MRWLGIICRVLVTGTSAWVLIPSCLIGPHGLSISVVNVNLFSNLQKERWTTFISVDPCTRIDMGGTIKCECSGQNNTVCHTIKLYVLLSRCLPSAWWKAHMSLVAHAGPMAQLWMSIANKHWPLQKINVCVFASDKQQSWDHGWLRWYELMGTCLLLM